MFYAPATTQSYSPPLHAALPISLRQSVAALGAQQREQPVDVLLACLAHASQTVLQRRVPLEPLPEGVEEEPFGTHARGKRSEGQTAELQSLRHFVCRVLR